MPKMKISGGLTGYARALRELGVVRADSCVKLALYEGARVVADQVRENLQALPEDRFRFLRNEQYNVVTPEEKADLLDALSVTPHRMEGDGWTVKIGFAGYGKRQHPTKKDPSGIPNNMIAGSIESGSSVRQKHPFVRPAVAQARARAQAAMQERFDEAVNQAIKE